MRAGSTKAMSAMAPAAKKKPPARAAKGAGALPRRKVVRRRALGPIGKLEDFIPYKLAVVANRVSQSIGHLFETQFNLQMPEWRIMMALYAYGDLVFADVVDRTSMDKARVSRANRRLIDLGLIGTAGDPKDGRRVILTLTSDGEKICAEILPEAAAKEAWFLAALDDEEHRQLDVILDKLMKRSLEQRDE